MTDWDRLLNIRTTGRDSTNADAYRYPYEPTPYPVLERLARSGYIDKRNVVLDYGCGKGRVGFFLARQTRCRCIGVEYDARIYGAACANRETAAAGGRVEFVHAKAEEYPVPAEADRFYFFNPFSPEILRSVLNRIAGSWYAAPRPMRLLFYYPSDEYVRLLMQGEMFSPDGEIGCGDLFPGDGRERVLVFRVDG